MKKWYIICAITFIILAVSTLIQYFQEDNQLIKEIIGNKALIWQILFWNICIIADIQNLKNKKP